MPQSDMTCEGDAGPYWRSRWRWRYGRDRGPGRLMSRTLFSVALPCSNGSARTTSLRPMASTIRKSRGWPATSRCRSGGGIKGWLGLAEEVSDISLACRQIGPIHFKNKMEQGDDMFRQRRSLFFKKMQIVRGCDAKRNVLVYMVYSDKLIEGSPKNSTSSIPIMPWGSGDTSVQKCGEFIQ